MRGPPELLDGFDFLFFVGVVSADEAISAATV